MDLQSTYSAALLLLPALVLDRWLGELRCHHPLVGFGLLAHWLEARLNRPDSGRWHGVVAVGVLVMPPVAGLSSLPLDTLFGTLVAVGTLYFTLGLRSLGEHGRAVWAAWQRDGLPGARGRVRLLVSRDTANLDPQGVALAGVESMLENGCDAVFGALFWFLLAGPAGALAYRLVNTLDAMWGYRTDRFLQFGWAAARLDDVMNGIPAYLTAITYGVVGQTRPALQAWRNRPAWKSPNAGTVMASGAGALGLRLGGAAPYHGQIQVRPQLGLGSQPQMEDILRALILVERGAWGWGVLAALVWGVLHFA
ncbi:MAG: cobalamin biosynthesis protein [Magnetococcus sp. DMHC-1]|nr:cobalamin biosynthesis protein [Magnetococcales bacterium]